MKKFLWISLSIFSLIVVWYVMALRADISSVNAFCADMQPGLDVRKIAGIANKYDVGFKDIRDPGSVDAERLGIKVSGKENTWFFVVVAPATIGEYGCDVYHNNKVVISAKAQ